jgi:hypothetical protein
MILSTIMEQTLLNVLPVEIIEKIIGHYIRNQSDPEYTIRDLVRLSHVNTALRQIMINSTFPEVNYHSYKLMNKNTNDWCVSMDTYDNCPSWLKKYIPTRSMMSTKCLNYNLGDNIYLSKKYNIDQYPELDAIYASDHIQESLKLARQPLPNVTSLYINTLQWASYLNSFRSLVSLSVFFASKRDDNVGQFIDYIPSLKYLNMQNVRLELHSDYAKTEWGSIMFSSVSYLGDELVIKYVDDIIVHWSFVNKLVIHDANKVFVNINYLPDSKSQLYIHSSNDVAIFEGMPTMTYITSKKIHIVASNASSSELYINYTNETYCVMSIYRWPQTMQFIGNGTIDTLHIVVITPLEENDNKLYKLPTTYTDLSINDTVCKVLSGSTIQYHVKNKLTINTLSVSTIVLKPFIGSQPNILALNGANRIRMKYHKSSAAIYDWINGMKQINYISMQRTLDPAIVHVKDVEWHYENKNCTVIPVLPKMLDKLTIVSFAEILKHAKFTVDNIKHIVIDCEHIPKNLTGVSRLEVILPRIFPKIHILPENTLTHLSVSSKDKAELISIPDLKCAKCVVINNILPAFYSDTFTFALEDLTVNIPIIISKNPCRCIQIHIVNTPREGYVKFKGVTIVRDVVPNDMFIKLCGNMIDLIKISLSYLIPLNMYAKITYDYSDKLLMKYKTYMGEFISPIKEIVDNPVIQLV